MYHLIHKFAAKSLFIISKPKKYADLQDRYNTDEILHDLFYENTLPSLQ
jgi:hypothetical protein